MSKEYILLTAYKADLIKMESILDQGKVTSTFISNYKELKETIIRMSNIEVNNAEPFKFKYEVSENGTYKAN